MIKKFLISYLVFFLLTSCAFRPLYKQSNLYHPHKVKIVVKSKERYENNVSMMRLLLNQRINKNNSKESNLKLVVSISRNIVGMGINKDLSSDARMIIIDLNYMFSDKKGKLVSGKLKNTANFNYTTNNYANMLAMEDTSEKLIKSLSNDLADLIIAQSFNRRVSP